MSTTDQPDLRLHRCVAPFGVLYTLNDRFDVNGQLGFRYNSGLSAIDALVGTGLEDVK